MSKGELGPKGWEVPTRAKKTEGSVEQVNAANNKLVGENTVLRAEVDALNREVASLAAALERLTGTDMASKIRTALEGFDLKDNSLWTDQGLPRIEAVCQAVENNEVTRADVEEAFPGFTRQQAPA